MERTWTVGSAEDLGLAVAEVRRARGMTQADAAAAAGIGRTWLAKLEMGRSTKVLDHLLRLLRRMGATIIVTWDVAAEPDGRSGHVDGRG